ncbi:helix-turn-helix domain-containing protein [Pelobacter propionicus]|uniref:Transcriptional regulator, MerR family n=1 Tax=Pelobacter propionicus (strain DSM 2379 / NBRC 103807 / OttBd1) TaxID=338966 RepID=A1AL86_PELPD|nr:XRE family transcriptional regulator [Pelobacter propionicus]ABK98106.1 transcriptional regulator, MerR family [Pelobacter propionicus DSM 2379]
MTDRNRIGDKITTIRESLGLTREQLAERCDCSETVIAGLEQGELAPSLTPLIKITRTLGVRLGTLLDDDTMLGPVVTRSGENNGISRVKSLEIASNAGALDFFSLAANKTARHMEPFIINVKPACKGGAPLSSHEGEEFIYILDGTVEVEYGKDLYQLEPGDSIYYDSIVPHQLRSRGSDSARILAVVYAPF